MSHLLNVRIILPKEIVLKVHFEILLEKIYLPKIMKYMFLITKTDMCHNTISNEPYFDHRTDQPNPTKINQPIFVIDSNGKYLLYL